MPKKIVIALGGNALGNNLEEQRKAVKITAKAIADLAEEGHQVIVSHGNGPQVGMIHLAMSEYHKIDPKTSEPELAVSVAMSQGYIGNDLEAALREELLNRGINKPVATLITQVLVDPSDPAFSKPTKPIGSFMTKEEADILTAKGENVVEDAGRGYRRVVASPKPIDIAEIESIRALCEAGQIVITCGGGGIPVVKKGNALCGVPAVIDKDFASAKLAQLLNADCLIILTAVEKVAINFNKPDQKWLSEISVAEAKKYIEEGHFAPGSMLPKVQAAIQFAESNKKGYALITLLEKAKDAIDGKSGTIIK
ncbi:carbamate kinase [Treponema denticola]|jgi:carbamate kinase|uniref:carbamate kinase n=1 Tax=Treponema denticola TaxID=158 RepID=UPI0002B5068C|nr:carbamate kinase [Treponema denticola]EMB42039.1 carbamate kinase [Treponema denticola ATCC 33520]UTC84366.1 carbamate kinase [Treponema denticola]